MIGYALSIGFIGIEMFGFLSGITMFSPTNGFICILFLFKFNIYFNLMNLTILNCFLNYLLL